MTDPDNPNPEPSKLELLTRSRWFLLAVVLVVSLVGSIVYYLTDPTIPPITREIKLFLMTLVIGAILAAIPATYLVDWLHTPANKYIVDYDASTDDFALYSIPAEHWPDLTVDEELHRLNASEPVFEARNYDPDEHHAEGTWRGTASDLELVEHREQVKETRNDLEQLAREGLAIRAKQSSVVRGAVADIVMDFIADFEEETTYSGDEIQSRIEDALDDLDTEQADDDQEDEQPESPLLETLQTHEEPNPQANGNK